MDPWMNSLTIFYWFVYRLAHISDSYDLKHQFIHFALTLNQLIHRLHIYKTMANPSSSPKSSQPREQIEGTHQAVHLRPIQEVGDEGGVQLAVATSRSNMIQRPKGALFCWSPSVRIPHEFHPQSHYVWPKKYPLAIKDSNWTSGFNRNID